MSRTRFFILALMAALLLSLSIVIFNFARAFILRPASQNPTYQWLEVATGFNKPVYLTHAGDESGRLFIIEQDGLIRILHDGAILAIPFLDVSDLVSRDGSERGLLGLAFHPNYADNGQFFINYTAADGKNTVARYRVSSDNPNQADPTSAEIILSLDDPYPNHNAGQLAFGPDGYLYIGTGDGGSAGDPQGNGQNGLALLGKMLRLDIDGGSPYAIPPNNPYVHNPAFLPEIWAYGLRNPWRYSFDRQTGDLYIADVGQNNWEEINFQSASSTGGQNYGWNIYEASYPFGDRDVPGALIMPIAEYSHADGCSVSGGYVYRGAALPTLQGMYIFGDFCSGTVWATERNESGVWQTHIVMNSGKVISSFGEDEQAELYLVDYGGSILMLSSS